MAMEGVCVGGGGVGLGRLIDFAGMDNVVIDGWDL